jgi:hypothetical protein
MSEHPYPNFFWRQNKLSPATFFFLTPQSLDGRTERNITGRSYQKMKRMGNKKRKNKRQTRSQMHVKEKGKEKCAPFEPKSG